MRDTIFAPATAPGRAAIAVVRLSGPGAAAALRSLAGDLPTARHATLRRLRDAAGEILDEALTLWFPAPASYTGEDCAELHLHGGVAVVEGVVRTLKGLGLRLAEPGEFTRRAFEAGRLGLDQAEAVADLVDAETDAQARQALAQLGGALGQRHEAWRAALTEALAYLEAAVDFPDEELPADVARRAGPMIDALAAELEAALADAQRGERIREGYRIAIVGAPNAGKSSLLNALIGRDAAIVTATPGTTRDVIEAPLVLGGYKALLADMAGLRAATETIEAEGVRRAQAWAADAALRLWIVDAAASDGAWRQGEPAVRAGDLVILNKTDLPPGADREAASGAALALGLAMLEASAVSGHGINALRDTLADRLAADLTGAEFPAVTRQRHEQLLAEALEHLRRGRDQLETTELAAEDLRLAARALGRITGRIGAEDILDHIFASFCIGK
ncbi:MAG: tRNA uridine-5-carboxymethylaminomethyl(34) synthesis GTPase MnmE [Caulobacterales bacterium]